MALYGRQGKIVAKAGQGAELTRILLGAAERADEMAGCRLYLIGMRKDEPEAVLVTEVWDDAAAHAASLNNPGVIATIAEARPLIERVEGFGMEVLGGLGVEMAHNGDSY
jgi:quinol monooxygenase YgiN